MDTALAPAALYAAPALAFARRARGDRGRRLVGRRRRLRVRGRARLRGRGAATTAATARSRSAGRGSRLSAVAASRETGGRAASGRPPADLARSARGAGRRKRFGGVGRPRGRRSRRCARAPSSASSGRTDRARRRFSTRSRDCVAVDAGAIRVAGAPAGSRAGAGGVRARSRRADGVRRADRRGARLARPRALGRGRAAADRARRCWSTAFGLDDRRDQRLGTLSRGLRRQASAVAALSLAPPLILVDEATATLDPEAVVVLGEAVAALAARGCGVLLATQDLHFAGAACHEIVLLHRGVVIDRGEPGALRARHCASSLEDVFLAALGDGRLRERVRDAFDAL